MPRPTDRLEAFESDDESDADLVGRCLEFDDDTAFGHLVERHQRSVQMTAHSVLGPDASADAEDIAQDVLVQARRNLQKLRDPKAFPAWVRRAAFNRAIDRVRRRSRRRDENLEARDDLPSSSRDPYQDAEQAQASGLLRQEISKLPTTYQATLRAVYWLGCTTAETAILLGVPEGTVKSYLYRSRQLLRHTLGES